MPMMSGDTRRPATIVPGSAAEMTARAKAPRTSRRVARTASASDTPPESSRSTRWAMTSVSVSVTNECPSSRSSWASSRQFSMMPLWTTARSPLQSRMGWALASVGWPCVAHRVWPMPADTALGPSSTTLRRSSSERVPVAARARHRVPPDCRATPAES